MYYNNIISNAIFIERPNRFIAYVKLGSDTVVCHVKNTGRCQELLIPGATVVVQHINNPSRKTSYDLIAVYKQNTLINIDSQAPNVVAKEYLPLLFPDALSIQPERPLGQSRIDFLVNCPNSKTFVEVKGVTLEKENHALFPDAPTTRGTRHIYELIDATKQGFNACLLFVIQMPTCIDFRPNDKTDPLFGQALRIAAASGVRISAVSCDVTENSMVPTNAVPIIL